MPREYESDDQKREGSLLVFSANVDCGKCGATYEGRWTDDSQTEEDMVDAPEAEQTCPGCGHVQHEVYPGWNFHSEAG